MTISQTVTLNNNAAVNYVGQQAVVTGVGWSIADQCIVWRVRVRGDVLPPIACHRSCFDFAWPLDAVVEAALARPNWTGLNIVQLCVAGRMCQVTIQRWAEDTLHIMSEDILTGATTDQRLRQRNKFLDTFIAEATKIYDANR